MASTPSGKPKKNPGSQNRFSEQDPKNHEMNGPDPAHPAPDPTPVMLNYNGESFLVSIRSVMPPHIEQPSLSVREAQVLQCLALGLSPDQTAVKLSISIRTVRKHLDNLSLKFQTDSRDQMMARAGYLRLCNPYKDVE
jgi:DNA-binding CsgD family transcriptional regulator